MQPHSDTCPVAFILATPLSEAQEARPVPRLEVGRDAVVGERLAEELVGRVPEQLLGGGVQVDDAAGPIDRDHGVQAGVEDPIRRPD